MCNREERRKQVLLSGAAGQAVICFIFPTIRKCNKMKFVSLPIELLYLRIFHLPPKPLPHWSNLRFN